MDAEHDETLLRSAGADADAGADGGSPSIEAEEQAHLDEVLGAVRAAVDRARGLAERTEASHREAGAQLAASRGELAPEETELRELTDSALCKLQTMTDDEFAELELYPDFDQ